MSGDIVRQLRDTRYPGQLEMRFEAADQIEKLRADLEDAQIEIRNLQNSGKTPGSRLGYRSRLALAHRLGLGPTEYRHLLELGWAEAIAAMPDGAVSPPERQK